MLKDLIIDSDDIILVTGANGFIGTKVVDTLLSYGFNRVRCLVRPSGNATSLKAVLDSFEPGRAEIILGNLISRDDCARATEGVSVIIHLAAGIEKSFAGSFMNSVVTTRNLLEAAIEKADIKRFVNVSSFALYSNINMKRGSLLDETCELEPDLLDRHDPYTFGKMKQDELVLEYAKKYDIPYVIVRPSVVYGPGKKAIPSRVGIGTFGIFLHLGGSITIPITYIDNCAEAIVLAGIKKGVDGEVFNIVDDDLPTSRQFLKMFKKNVKPFRSLYIPYPLFYLCCYLWEKYSKWSHGQLPPAFNRRKCATYWKGNTYTNRKIKERLGWKPRVAFSEASRRYFEFMKKSEAKG